MSRNRDSNVNIDDVDLSKESKLDTVKKRLAYEKQNKHKHNPGCACLDKTEQKLNK